MLCGESYNNGFFLSLPELADLSNESTKLIAEGAEPSRCECPQQAEGAARMGKKNPERLAAADETEAGLRRLSDEP